MKLSEDVFWKYYNYRREDDKWDYKKGVEKYPQHKAISVIRDAE